MIALIERTGHSLKVMIRNRKEVELFGEILPELPVSVLIEPALSRISRIGKVFFCSRDFLYLLVVKELISAVKERRSDGGNAAKAAHSVFRL